MGHRTERCGRQRTHSGLLAQTTNEAERSDRYVRSISGGTDGLGLPACFVARCLVARSTRLGSGRPSNGRQSLRRREREAVHGDLLPGGRGCSAHSGGDEDWGGKEYIMRG